MQSQRPLDLTPGVTQSLQNVYVSLLGPENHWPLPNTKGSDGSLLLGEGRVVEWSFLLKTQGSEGKAKDCPS